MRPLTASMYARLNVERTHTRETRGSRFLNNAHVLYRKCLFIVGNNIPPVHIGLNGSYTLFLLPFYHALLTMYIYTQSNCWAGDLLCGGRGLHVPRERSTRSGGGAQCGLLERFSFPHQGLSCMTLHIPYFSVYL